MGEPAHHRFSFGQYLMLEEDSGLKHEFLEGQVWAMSGGTPEHAAVAGNVLTLLNVQLAGKKCRVFTSDLRIRVVATGLGTYPDVSVVCGHLELDPEDAKRHTVVNPRILVEVLSPSTDGVRPWREASPVPAGPAPSTRSCSSPTIVRRSRSWGQRTIPMKRGISSSSCVRSGSSPCQSR